MPYNKRRLRRKRHLNDLSMTPLIDVALTLLVIFMITSPIIHNAIKITLPHGSTQEDAHNPNNDTIVFVDKQGDFYISNAKMAKIELINHLKKTIGNDQDKTVYVHADTAVSYGTVIELVDDIKVNGGIHYVALATQKHLQTAPSMG